jgi:hypothetical protein
MRMPRPSFSTVFFVLLAIVASSPAWIVRYPPLEDLPFHLSAIRLVHDFHTSRFGFEQDFELTLGRTQYVLYYVVGSLLAYVVGVTKANILLMSVYLAGTPLALRSLLRALDKDERIAILIIPLLVNVMFMFGLLPFVFGIPIMFWALAAAVRYFDALTHASHDARVVRKRALALAALCFALFYSHVFPFFLFGLGFAAMFPWKRPALWVRAALPTVPTLAFVGYWFAFTAAGKVARGAVNGDSKDFVQPLDQALGGAYGWITNVFKDTTDELWFIAFALVALIAVGLAQADKERARPEARALVLLPIACFVLYFTTGESRGPVWLFSQRFPILFLITLVPLLRFPRGWRGAVTTALAVFVAVGSTVNVCKHFIRFQLDEVGDIDEAIAAIPPAKHVAALIFDKYSGVINWAPFLHFGSYYQLEKGGVIQFSYAGYVHWPFTYKEGHFPPQPGLPPGPARPRWEWTPESIPVHGELYPYYDYVLVRGAGFRPPPGTFHMTWHGDRWSVWQRD